jgi:hypothetical protein
MFSLVLNNLIHFWGQYGRIFFIPWTHQKCVSSTSVTIYPYPVPLNLLHMGYSKMGLNALLKHKLSCMNPKEPSSGLS